MSPIMRKLYKVTLTSEEVWIVEDIVKRGKHTAQKRNRAHALLLAHHGLKDREISKATSLSTVAIEQVRKRFVENGFEATLEGMPKAARPRALDGRAEAFLVATVCSPCPDGHEHWTLKMLQGKLEPVFMKN
ncbi:hypothetical protein AGMMS50296_8450 [Alphaproteobacteria bacterium]|nr:hypothetical protein AGMMS50296_8450 [Alphaproteobacteria bacterium]